MTERKIETRYGIEAYISEKGFICLKQEDPMQDEDQVIIMDPIDIPVIIKWLQELVEERKNFEITEN